MPLITVNLSLVSPYGEDDIPKPASGRVEFVPAIHGTLDGSLRTVEKITSPVISGVMTPVELAPGPWKVRIQPARKNDWPEMIFHLEEGMSEPVNLADLVPDFIFDGHQLAKGEPGPGIVGSRMINDSTLVFIYENGEESDPITMPVGRTPTITWNGTKIVVDGVTGPDLKGDTGATGHLVYRGVVPDGTNFNLLVDGGIYTVSSVASAATMTNMPTNRAGTLFVLSNPNSGVTTHDYIAHTSSTARNERYSRTKLLASTTSWSPWASSEWIKGRIPIGTNVDTFREIGAWTVVLASDATGLPGTRQGELEVITINASGMALQRFTERVSNSVVNVWHRFTLATGGWGGVSWDLLNKPAPEPEPALTYESDVSTSDHATRVEFARSRRGGSIGTNGLPVVMIRFDHWMADFRDKCLPILKDNSLVGTLNVNYDNLSNEQNGGGNITWLDVQGWNQTSGIEIANHGSTHTNVNTREAIYHEIVDGRRNLEAAMPWTAVETWHEHGSAYLVASDIEGDTGLDLGRTLESFTESYAGRLVMAEHAVVEGKIGGFYPPLTGSPQVGQSHYSIDRLSSTDSIKVVEDSKVYGRGLTIYLHPGLLDHILVGSESWKVTYNTDGSRTVTPSGAGSAQQFATDAAMRTWATTNGYTVYQTTEDFRRLCQYLTTERDSGRIMVMTSAGGGFADKSHARRENILLKSDFTQGYGSWWSGTSGWTITNPGPNVELTSSASGTELRQSILMYTRFGWAMGATHEFVVHAKSNVATSITLTMDKTNLPEVGEWISTKTFTVPGDGVVRPYRVNFTIPRALPNLQMAARISGNNVTIVGNPIISAV